MDYPLISCIMPTRNRRQFIAQALHYFDAQDYPNKELIIVDDGDDLVVDLVSEHPGVRYLAPQYIHTVGAKRNLACEVAQGEIICHWDDDDWYASSRLSYQVQPLLTNEADIAGLHLQFVLDLQKMQAWQCEDIDQRVQGVDGMHYGTMMYYKRLWQHRARFQDSIKGDDGSGFVRRLINRGARATTLPCAGHQIYMRHGKNIWKYRPGNSIGGESWQTTASERCVPRTDLSFYHAIHTQLSQKKPYHFIIGQFREQVDHLMAKTPGALFRR